MARLLYTDSSGRQLALELDPSRAQTVIGRQADCEIVAYDTSVSRRHCIVVPEDGGYVVVDLGSANGTLVNDQRITRRRLISDDVIRCGVYDVRFVDSAADSRENLADRYRRARGATPDAALRQQLERLQSFNDNQNQRLVQVQEELARSDAERNAAVERLTRVEAELRVSRPRLAELEDHLRGLLATLEQRERELDALRAMPAPPPSQPPPPTAPAPAPSLAAAALAAENVALRSQVASLHGALAVDDAYERAARLVPTVDRWQALSATRAALDDAERARHALIKQVDAQVARAESAERRAQEARQAADDAERRVRDAERRAREADTRARGLDERLRAAVERPSAEPRSERSLGRSLADANRSMRATGGLLAALGGLGETARSAPSERPQPTPGPVVPELEARIRVLEDAATRAAAKRARALADVRVLVERLTAFRETTAPHGVAAVQLAELMDLARSIDATSTEPTDEG